MFICCLRVCRCLLCVDCCVLFVCWSLFVVLFVVVWLIGVRRGVLFVVWFALFVACCVLHAVVVDCALLVVGCL